MKKILPLSITLFVIIVFFFFKPFLFNNALPIPSDTIVGLYHPFRDLYAKAYPRGIPFKNFLITDPVRQQYPWRELSIEILERWEIPLWNPYSFAGTPLLANFQSAVFYPLNVLFFILPFYFAWSLLIFSQPLLGGLFLYLYLSHILINKWASLLGAVVFSFSGFSIAWMEWNTILHVGLWLPLILLSLDKIILSIKYKVVRIKLFWNLLFLFSLVSSFFAGHLQTFFYVAILSTVYFFVRWIQYGKNKKILFLYIILNTCFLILTSIQWFSTLQFILLSARDVDQANWQQEGWFIPWQHLIQFIVPDFFGNPTTLNYWGVWNYGEFIGYIGIFPLVIALFALFFRHDKKTLFFGALFFLSLAFSLPTIFAKLPFMLNIPFLATAQPTRLLFVTDFSLAILAALGFDYFLRVQKRKILYPLGFIALLLIGLWIFLYIENSYITPENITVAKRNLIFPTAVFFAIALLISSIILFHKRLQRITIVIYIIIVGVTVFDLLRFGTKFTPFTQKQYLFPQTKAFSFLQDQEGHFRIMSTDSRILPPNFSTIYRLQSVDGYDPLYLGRYGELIAASERGKPNISPPFGFNRIITPHNYDSRIIDLLGVKYILSLSDISSSRLKIVFEEGQTKVYENKSVLPRVFFVEKVKVVKNKNEAIKSMFEKDFDPRKTAIVEKTQSGISISPLRWTKGVAEITKYSENRVVIETKNEGDGFLILTDSFYSSWRSKIDNNRANIVRTDYNFKGIFVPKGKHIVDFYITLL